MKNFAAIAVGTIMLSACGGGSGSGNSAPAVPSIATTTAPSDAPSASTTAQAFPAATSLATPLILATTTPTSTPSSQAFPAATSLATPLILATITPTITPSPTPTFAPFVSYSGHYSPNGNRVIRGPYGIQVAPRFAAIPGAGQSDGPLPIEFDYTVYDQMPSDVPGLGDGRKIIMLAKVTVTSPQTVKQSLVFYQIPQAFLNGQSPPGTSFIGGVGFHTSKYENYRTGGWYLSQGLTNMAGMDGTMVPGETYYFAIWDDVEIIPTPAPTVPSIFLDSKLRKN